MCDIANEAFALGERFSEDNLITKSLRSLPRRFTYKVTTVEEANDILKMKFEELIGSLRTFKMNLGVERGEMKEKMIQRFHA